MAPSFSCESCKHENLASIPRTHINKAKYSATPESGRQRQMDLWGFLARPPDLFDKFQVNERSCVMIIE